MNKERNNEVTRNNVSESYLLPDGLSCNWIYISDDISDEQLISTIDETIDLSRELDTEVRISQDTGEKISLAVSYIKDKYNFEPPYGRTTFFEIQSTEVESESTSSLDNYTYYPLEMRPDLIGVVKSLMIGSFGTTSEKIHNINAIFDTAIHLSTNRMFIVLDKNSDLVVGTFLLKYIPALREVQLHSVAGISSDPRVSQVRGKLPILMACVLDEFRLNYPNKIPFGIGQSNFIDGGIDKLTFSSSGAAPLYKKIGIKESLRSGFVINKGESTKKG